MIASLLIIAFSVVLLLYWFRYSCLLLLRHNAAGPNPLDNRFGFTRVQRELQGEADLDALHRTLERDYRVLMYLVEHAAGLNLPSLEDRLLVIDYKVMHFCYRGMRFAAPRQARRVLAEMADIVAVLVQHISEQAGVRAEA